MTVVYLRSVPRVDVRRESSARRLTRLIVLLRTWIKRSQQRHELAGLSDEQLRDVGLNRHTIKREIEKPFWMA